MHSNPGLVFRALVRLAGLLGLAGALLVGGAPAHGYRTTPGQTAPPSSLQDWCPGNLLANPSFEEGSRKTENLGTSLSSAVGYGWFPWFIRGDQRFNREPEFKVEDATRDPLRWRVHTGYFSQKFFTTWATHTAGVYQTVAVRPNSVVNFSIWVQIYTGEADGWDGEKFRSDPDAPGNYRASIGIDPFGNTPAGVGAPPPDTVIWSEPIMTYDNWTQLSIQAVAQTDHVTVYTRGQPEFSVKHNDSFWDTACLTVVGPAIPPGADAVVDTALLNFRAGPGTEYDIIGTLERGAPLVIKARLADNSWLSVTDDTGTAGWVFTKLLYLGVDLDEVPIAESIPPTPTPIPSETPEPSPTTEPTATTPPTDTPTPTITPEPTDTPVPTLTTEPAVTPQVMAKAKEARSSGQAQPTSPAQNQPAGALPALNCFPGLIALGVGMLGLLSWPRRWREREERL